MASTFSEDEKAIDVRHESVMEIQFYSLVMSKYKPNFVHLLQSVLSLLLISSVIAEWFDS